MKLADHIGDLIKLAVIGGAIYMLVQWRVGDEISDEDAALAEKSCLAEVSRRFDGQAVSAYSVEANDNGYVVQTSVTVRPGVAARVYCIANRHGGVEDIRIVEH